MHCHHLENEQTRIFLDAYAEVSGFYPSTKLVMCMRVALHLHAGLWGFTKAHNGFSDPYHSDWGAQHLNRAARAIGLLGGILRQLIYSR